MDGFPDSLQRQKPLCPSSGWMEQDLTRDAALHQLASTQTAQLDLQMNRLDKHIILSTTNPQQAKL